MQPNEDVYIRNAAVEDLPAVEKVDKEIFGTICYPLFVLRQFYEITTGLFVVAENRRKEIIGYSLGHLDAETRTGWVMALAVKDTYRGRGVGLELTSHLLERFKERSANLIKLTVHPENRSAITLYRKLGFRAAETEDNYFGNGEPRLVMEKTGEDKTASPPLSPADP